MHDFCALVSFFFACVAAKLLTYCAINKNLRINQQTLLILLSLHLQINKNRSYVDCPKCKQGEYVKAGFVKNRQRYKCKNCGYYYSVAKKSDVKTEETRRMALELYLEGLRFRAIDRLSGISFGTVYQWIKKLGKQLRCP
jgi:transposase-like protein